MWWHIKKEKRMIVSNRKHSFGSKMAIIETANFSCMVSTAKDNLFAKPSTIIFEGNKHSDLFSLSPRIKILYSSALPVDSRLDLHDLYCRLMNVCGEEMPIRDAIFRVGIDADLDNRVRKTTIQGMR